MMLAKKGTTRILKSKGYIFEPKLDGYRTFCRYENGTITLRTRNGIDITERYKDMEFILKKDCIIDGELIIYDEKGNPSFSLMQRRKGNATYVAFDILEAEGENIRRMPIEERKMLLKEIVTETKSVQIMPMTENGEALWKIMEARRLEGVIAKKKGSRYTSARSPDWLKIKNEKTMDCIIAGYITKTRTIASLSLALYDDEGKMEYIGQVGTGFTESFLEDLKKRMIVGKNSARLPSDAISVSPVLVCEVKYLMMTPDRRLRAPVFIRLREDKEPEECTTRQIEDA
jgi:bifunctional non-homologous end joining protein LigD